MRSLRLSGPSPAMVVACVALSFALAGSAVAGTDALNRAVTKSKVKQIAKKQAKKQLRKNVSGSHVNIADNATNATNATERDERGQRHANATNAANGARGFARVRPNGQVRAGAFGVNNLVQPFASAGIYCEDAAYQTASLTGGLTHER